MDLVFIGGFVVVFGLAAWAIFGRKRGSKPSFGGGTPVDKNPAGPGDPQ